MSYIAFRLVARISISYVDDYMKLLPQTQIMTDYFMFWYDNILSLGDEVCLSCKGKKNVLFMKVSYQVCFKNNFVLS